MSIKISFGGATILRGGAYSQTKVALVGGFPLSDTGIVAIVGEAAQGAPGDADGVQVFTCEQLSDLINKYVSGNIVDAARLLVQPSKDARVPNGAQKVFVWKTNSSTAASKTIQNMDDAASDILTLTSANYGYLENNINIYITDGVSSPDAAAVITSGVITFPVVVANNDTLIITVNGVDYTCTVSTAPGGTVSMTQSQWVTLLNGTPVVVGADTATPVWATVKPCVFAAVSTDKISATLNRAQAPFDKYEKMWEYSFMSVKTSAIKTKLVMTVASTVSATTLVVTAGSAGPVRGSRGGRVVVINKGDVTDTLLENDNEECFKIMYTGAGTDCLFTISGASDLVKTLSTSCAGAAGDNLSILLSGFATIQDLVTYLDNVLGGTKYTCVTSYSRRNSRSPVALDRYDAIDLKVLPLGVKCAVYEIAEDIINESSQLATVVRGNVYGQVETISSSAKEFFTGGAKGASVDADFDDGFDALLGIRANYVVPLISQDASADITDGLTDAGSTYTITSVMAAADSHVKLASNTKNRSERRAYPSFKGTFAATKAVSKNLASERSSLVFQNVDALNAAGSVVTMQPWATACLVAGIKAGAPIGTNLMYKYINAWGISHQDYNPVTDIDTAIDSGLFVIEKPPAGGYRIAVDNTTYGKDASFCWNRGNVIDAADFVAYDSRVQLENIYIGSGHQRGTATVKSVYTTLTSLMQKYLDAGVLIGDLDTNYLGYKDLTVTMTGSVITYSVTIVPEVGVEFILANITIDQSRDTSST